MAFVGYVFCVLCMHILTTLSRIFSQSFLPCPVQHRFQADLVQNSLTLWEQNFTILKMLPHQSGDDWGHKQRFILFPKVHSIKAPPAGRGSVWKHCPSILPGLALQNCKHIRSVFDFLDYTNLKHLKTFFFLFIFFFAAGWRIRKIFTRCWDCHVKLSLESKAVKKISKRKSFIKYHELAVVKRPEAKFLHRQIQTLTFLFWTKSFYLDVFNLYLILLQESSEGRQKVSERSNPLSEERKGDSGHCTASPPMEQRLPFGQDYTNLCSLQTRRQIVVRSVKLRPFIISQESGAQANSKMRTHVWVVPAGTSSSTQACTALFSDRKFEGPVLVQH